MDLKAILDRVLRAPPIAAARAPLDVFGQASGGLLARGLAFSALFAAIPTFLLMLGVVGWAAGDPTARDRISATLISAVPPLAGLIGDSIQALSDGAALTSIVGVVGVLWTVSQFYGALDQAFSRIYAGQPERSMILRTARGLAAVAILVGSVVGLIVFSSLALTLEAMSATQAQPVDAIASILGSAPVLVGLASLIVLLLYRAVPPRRPTWRAAVLPAVVVGSVSVVLSRAFVYLVPRLVGVEALAGSLASAFVTLAWLSLIFQALLLGAAWVRVRDEGRPGTPVG